MTTSTVRLHRVLCAKPERVYRAFLDADAMCKWLPPNGFTGKVQHLDARVGGTYRMSFTNFTTGDSHSFGGKYLELVPHERIVHTDRFDDPGGFVEGVQVYLEPDRFSLHSDHFRRPMRLTPRQLMNICRA